MVFYSVSEVADILGVHPETVRRWIRQGKLKALKTGDSSNSPFKIKKEYLEGFIKDKSV